MLGLAVLRFALPPPRASASFSTSAAAAAATAAGNISVTARGWKPSRCSAPGRERGRYGGGGERAQVADGDLLRRYQVQRLAVSTITSNHTMLFRESTNTHNEAGPEGALFGWCRKDRYRCSCTGWHISPHLLRTIVSTAFILQSMDFYLLIFELGKLVQHVWNFMLAHPQRAKYTITKSIMELLWTPSIIIMLTIVHINLTHMLCGRLQSILLEYMTSHLLPMQYIMIVFAVP